MSSLELTKLSSLVYPIMLAQEAGELSEGKACELIGMGVVAYREAKAKAVASITQMVESLPSPLVLLLESTKGQQG